MGTYPRGKLDNNPQETLCYFTLPDQLFFVAMFRNRSDYYTQNQEGAARGMGKTDREALLIKKQRKEAHMTQSQIAAEVGIELQEYQRYEYGKAKLSNATMKVELRICAALELSRWTHALVTARV